MSAQESESRGTGQVEVHIPAAHVYRIDTQDAAGLTEKAKSLFADSLQYSFRFPDAMRIDSLRTKLKTLQLERGAGSRLHSFKARWLLFVLTLKLLWHFGKGRQARYEQSQLIFKACLQISDCKGRAAIINAVLIHAGLNPRINLARSCRR